MLGFVRIAADPDFVVGTRNADREWVARIAGFRVADDEINELPTPTREFHIARYPVTVAQFRAFVAATGFAIGDADALADPDSRPVRWVSWHEALAWCDWLNEMLATSPALVGSRVAALVREHGWRVALPSELEWEKAARGGLRGAVFPWGDDADAGHGDGRRANHRGSRIEGTSVVGCFPANDYGLHDLAGNVWEWTRSLWGTDWVEPRFAYPYDVDDPRREDLRAGDFALRVVRGGSWRDQRNCARSGIRHRYHPGYSLTYLGFRVVLRSSPVLPL